MADRAKLHNALLCVTVFGVAFFYRFNTLGGALGGFSNDEFGYLARARQILGGEVPFRDFNDPGWFLTDYLSAAAQWVGGYNLRSEALLTVGMLSLAAGLTFLLARRASGSIAAALVGVALQLAFEPRHYNYPKIVLYAAGIALAWAYADKPGWRRLAGLGLLIGVGFLFRHDHLVYLGALGLMTVALVHRSSIRAMCRAVAVLGAAACACIIPFLLFLALNGGVGEYFRAALVYVTRDAQRTSFSLPRFSWDASRPLAAVTREQPGGTRISVRWATAPESERRAREARYRLAGGSQHEGTWSYVLQDVSSRNIEALVRDPLVSDTHGLDRARYRVEGADLRFESQLDSVQNSTAYLYYFLIAVPAVAAIMFVKARAAGGDPGVMTDPAHMVPLLVLAAMLDAGFLSRGSTNIRIADVSVTAAVLIAWIISALAGRSGQAVLPPAAVRVLARTIGGALLLLAVLSANGIGRWWPHLDDAFFTTGPAHVVTRARQVWTALGIPPAAFNADDEQPPVLRMAGYVSACTAQSDRLFILSSYPEVYYFSGRLFAGGHAWLLPLYYGGDADQARIVDRLDAVSVPIVLTEPREDYDEDYVPAFGRVAEYLRAKYVEVGEVDYGGGQRLRVLARADLKPTGRYERLDLPCFR